MRRATPTTGKKLSSWKLSSYLTMLPLMTDRGKGTPILEGYTKIPCHFIYDLKYDGRHKARFVAGGHRTDTPIDSVYSGVVSIPGIRIATMLAELHEMHLWSTDISNTYLESFTAEKVVFIAGPEFGKLEGHTMVIIKAQ